VDRKVSQYDSITDTVFVVLSDLPTLKGSVFLWQHFVIVVLILIFDFREKCVVVRA
jgi:hypothetical protein